MEFIDFHFDINFRKIQDYLLNIEHPRGKSKAKWLLAKGFDQNSLVRALIRHGKEGHLVKEEQTEFGVFITIEGTLALEAKPVGSFRSVWELVVEQKKCRFVTAYPI
jgi:hypothetical protein